MSKENLLSISIFVSVWVCNPLIAQVPRQTNSIQSQQNTSIGTDIANRLSNRGLTMDAAQKLSCNFIHQDEEKLTQMIENILQLDSSISRDELLSYLSNEALFRRKVQLDTYDHLVAMIHKIKQKAPNHVMRQKLENIANQNQGLLA